MNPNVTTTNMNINGREFVLAEVSRGMGQIGVFRYTSNAYAATDYFYMEKEPIVKIVSQNTNDQQTNKLITHISGSDALKNCDYIKARLSSAADNYFQYNQGLARSAVPALELLSPGLYVVHDSQMHQCDGEGKFFWNSYNYTREVKGTSEKNPIIGDANYSPCFLIPTQQPSSFQVKQMTVVNKSEKKLCGVAYHVSGMFSALLTGHHEATAAMLNETDFRCLVIEPITDVVYDLPKTDKKRKIVALSCPFIKIPLDEFPDNTLERFLISRKHIKPATFSDIRPKMGKTLRTVSKRAFPNEVYEKAEQLPDCALVEASSAVNSLSEAQTDALLAGNVKYTIEEGETTREEYVISNNYYSSVVAAANYLQVTDFTRFMDFAIALLKNDELTTVHKHIAERLLTVMHPTIQEYFASIIGENEEPQPNQDIIKETAHKYKGKWAEYSRRKKAATDGRSLEAKKRASNMQAITETKGIVTLEMAVRDIGDMPRGSL